jgi:predicted nucleic acid-binding protein
MVIVDTTVWIDYLGGTNNAQTAWLDREISHQRLGLTDTILCEVLQGVCGEGVFARVRNDLSKAQVFTTGGIDLAVGAEQNYRSLRRRAHSFAKQSIA